MDKSYTERSRITIEGNRIILGGASFSLDELSNVRVALHANKSFWRLYIFAGIIFLGTLLLLFLVGMGSIASGTASQPVWNWVLGILFFGGTGICGVLFIYALLAYPPAHYVEVGIL